MKINAALILAGVFIATMYTGIVYSVGSSRGKAITTEAWLKENKKRDEKTNELTVKNTKLEAENKALVERIAKELAANEKRVQKAILAVHAEYAQRMYHSQAREGIYREQAAGTAAERDRLASHAAELDRALEEGRLLVEELRHTLGLRDSQLELLGQQIRADRALLE